MSKFLVYLGLLLAATNQLVLGDEWLEFKRQHGIEYRTHLEDQMRRSLFVANKEKVERFNRENSALLGYELGLNHLADWTDEEYSALSGTRLASESSASIEGAKKAQKFLESLLAKADKKVIPAEVDWTKVEGRVSPVGNQGHCTSDWAFSAVGALEGQLKAQNKSFTQLSVQNLLDCSVSNNGCAQGITGLAFEDIAKAGGIEDAKSYPYVGAQQDCRFNKSRSVFTDTGTNVLINGEENLKIIVALYGPVSTAIDASHDSFKFYKDGVYYEKQCRSDVLFAYHGALIVGYGTDAKTGADYWLVKNSWGTNWGIGGYIKMARNRNNNCNIATSTGVPTFD